MEYLRGIQSEPQIPTHFPNDNTKRIDYVLVYKFTDSEAVEHEHEKKEQVRQKFFEALREESFEIYTAEFKASENHVYALLHCPLERLFKEAELVKMEMRLNNVSPRRLLLHLKI
jgi:hypothetical protein